MGMRHKGATPARVSTPPSGLLAHPGNTSGCRACMKWLETGSDRLAYDRQGRLAMGLLAILFWYTPLKVKLIFKNCAKLRQPVS